LKKENKKTRRNFDRRSKLVVFDSISGKVVGKINRVVGLGSVDD
jgi:hypothetical protein